MKRLIALSVLAPAPLLADSFLRSIPQAQSATAESWFAVASLALVAALVFVARLVARR